MHVVAGLEVSTSAAKCILFDFAGRFVAAATVPFSAGVSDTVSQDPEGMAAAALEALTRVIAESPCQLMAIGLGATWHSLLLLDEERRPLRRIRTWADTEAATVVRPIREDKERAVWFYQRTGCMPHAMYPLWKWMGQREGISRPVFLSSQVEYLFQQLTGERKVSRNIASGTGLLHLEKGDWDEDVLRYAGIDRSQLGELSELESAAPLLKEIAERIGTPSGIPVTVGGADGALTQIGLGGGERSSLSLSIGTSGAIRVALPEPFLPEEPALWCYHLRHSRWLAGAATHAGNNLLRVMEEMGYEKGMESLEALLQERTMEDAPIFLPFLFGERCPGWAENRQGGFYERRPHHGEAELYGSVLEGILFNLFQCFQYFPPIETTEPIRVTGGILHSPLWLQMAADIFDRPLVATDLTHDSVAGAAVVARQSIGVLPAEADEQPEWTHIVEPRAEMHRLHMERYRRYLAQYRGSEA